MESKFDRRINKARNNLIGNVYSNQGNRALIDLLPTPARVLDCGCGAGDTARLLRDKGCKVVGITINREEQDLALPYCEDVILADLEKGIPKEVGKNFDIVLFSHFLEHVRNPDDLLQDIKGVLSETGIIAVALPNVLHYRNRIKFLLGKFQYEDGGTMDENHIRFYTFESGRHMLIENGFEVFVSKTDGGFPFWKFRRFISKTLRNRIDTVACRLFPGVFGAQSLFIARISSA